MVDAGRRLELFEAKWIEVPAVSDAVNIDFVRKLVGKSRIAINAIVCRKSNSFPMTDGLQALPVTELGEGWATLNGKPPATFSLIAAFQSILKRRFQRMASSR